MEAASVCLIESEHESPTPLALTGRKDTATITFSAPDDRAFASRADPDETTERGATAVAIALVQELKGLTVVHRSRKGTGCDWYIGRPANDPMEGKFRLEVSEIRRESDKLMRSGCPPSYGNWNAGTMVHQNWQSSSDFVNPVPC